MTESDLKKYRRYLHARELAAAALEEFEPSVYAPRTQKISPVPANHGGSGTDRLSLTLDRIERLRQRVERLDELISASEELLIFVADLLQTDTERDVLVYHYYKGLSISDTVKRIGCARSSYFNYKNRILERIKGITYVITE